MTVEKFLTHFLLFILFLFLPTLVFTQTTTVEGFIKEQNKEEPVIYAHIRIKGSDLGTVSNENGYFSLTVDNSRITSDTLLITSMGYKHKKVGFKIGQKQELLISLEADFLNLGEVVIKAGENPAFALIDKVIKNKKNNDPEAREYYSTQEYSKIRFDLNHFTEKIKENFLFRPFDYIWENADTTETGINYLPILLVEKLMEHYYRSSPKTFKTYVQAVNREGFAGKNIMKYVEDLYLSPNIYQDYVVILEKNFPSPVGKDYKSNYDVYITDSTSTGDDKTYQVIFEPKHKHNLAFQGEMLIDSGSYAIKEVLLRFDVKANINFVRSYMISQKYDEVEEGIWMMTESNLIGDFTVLENSAELTGFFGRKNSLFKNYKVNTTIPKAKFEGPEMVVELEGVDKKDSLFWVENRMMELTDKEMGIFKMVDQLEQDPDFKIRKHIAHAVATGYIPWGNFEIGNYYTFYSRNYIEGSRVKFGFRSGSNFRAPISFSNYVAFGFADKQWKYGLSVDVTLGEESKNKKVFGASYKKDLEQLGRSFSQIPLDHVFSSFVQIGDDASRNYVKEFNAYYDNHWSLGLVTRLSYFNNFIIRPGEYTFEEVTPTGDIITHDQFHTAGVGLALKYSWQYKDVKGDFYDKDLLRNTFRKYPDVAIEWRYSDAGTFNSDFTFHKLRASLNQQLRVKKYGYFKYYLEAGKTFGTVPYPVLDIPPGNQLVFNNDLSFNLMGFLEYAADEYISVNLQHHFDGYIMDRIPLINKLKWRSFVFWKGYFSNLSDKNNQEVYLFPQGLSLLNEPYHEIGFGFENIFKISRIDFIWRLTDTNHPEVYYFIVKPSFKLGF